MTKARDPEALLTAYLAIGMDVLPDRVADSVMDEVHRTRQRVVLRPWRRRPVSRTTFAAAMAVAVVMVGSAFFVIQRGQPAIIGPAPTASPSARPSQSAVASPTLSPPPSAEATPSPVAPGAKLTWTKVDLDQRSPRVAWLGGRFVLADQDSGAVYTSTDGISWEGLQPGDPDASYADLLGRSFASWGDSAVGWWNPQEEAQCGNCTNQPPITARDVVQIVRPPGAPTSTTPFKGRIESMAVGPAGIVAEVHSDIDWDAWVTETLGVRTNNAWVKHLKGVDYRDGILQIKLDNGPGLKVVWAADGRAPGDFQDKGFAWYSPDGEQWTAIPPVRPALSYDDPTFPMGSLGGVVGVSDGFIATGASPDGACADPDGSCTGMWYSSDGLTWRNIGNVVNGGDESMLAWMGGALVTDGVGRFDFWTSQGRTELPMAAQVRAASKQPNEAFDTATGTGPLGAVMVSNDNQEILVTRDGVDWDIQSMPAEMAADRGGRERTTVAVGERSVLVLVGGSLWLGTLQP